MEHRQTIERMAAQGVASEDILQHLVEDCGLPRAQALADIEQIVGSTGLAASEPAQATASDEPPLRWGGWLLLAAAALATLATGIPQATIALTGRPVEAVFSEYEPVQSRWLGFLDSRDNREYLQYRFELDGRAYTGIVSQGAMDAPVVYYAPRHPAWHSPDDGFPWWRTALLPLLGWIAWRESRLRWRQR